MNYYRKLKIKDIEYKYHISKGDTVKIVTPNGNVIVKKIDIALDAGTSWLITPGMIKDYIINGKIKEAQNYLQTCKCNAEKFITVVTFDAEIYGKIKYVYWCDKCYENNNGDI